jgi:hypothetical protein
MTAYVFLGPSLPLGQAKTILDVNYLPPVQQGDVLRLLDSKPRYIGIIDGYFETVPAVWHKEILLALSRGVRVFGAASMGALRAAELQQFGMIGVGKIFQWLSDETIVADDEVAVRHGPAELGYLPLSQSLVDIRDCCALALDDRLIDAPLAERIISAARAIPFWDRTWDAIADRLQRDEPTRREEIRAWLEYARSSYVSLKARDAAALLAAIKDSMAEPWTIQKPNFAFEHTIFIDRLLNEIAIDKTRKSLDLAPEPDREQELMQYLRRAALLRLVAREAADRCGWQLSRLEVTERANALWAHMGITDSEGARRWMQCNGISEQMLQSYIADELYIARLVRAYRVEVDRELALQLLMSNPDHPNGCVPSSGSAPSA